MHSVKGNTLTERLISESECLLITGTRGIPAHYGGFETLVERLVYSKDFHTDLIVVTGFSPTVSRPLEINNEVANNIVSINFRSFGWHHLQNLIFSFSGSMIALFKYNPKKALVFNNINAILILLLRILGVKVIFHTDGDESRRRGLSKIAKLTHHVMRLLACNLANIIIIDSSYLLEYIPKKNQYKCKTIKYGYEERITKSHTLKSINNHAFSKKALVVARFVAENNILEICQAALSWPPNWQLVVYGQGTGKQSYESKISALAERSNGKIWIKTANYNQGLIIDELVASDVYIHGHEVGGTNPILVNARKYAKAIFANDNKYNRDGATSKEFFWGDIESLSDLIERYPQANLSVDSISDQGLLPNWSDISLIYSKLLQSL